MIGIIGAMESEVETLMERMEEVEIIQKASMEFCKGKLCGKDTVLVQSGIGKVNAAVCTQILIDVFDVELVINTGIAGAVNEELELGDVVISEDAFYHDVDAVEFGYERGQVPQMEVMYFPADDALVEIARRVNKQVNPSLNTVIGRIGTGDQFIASVPLKKWMLSTFKVDCVEMEGAAIAHTAYLNNVSFVIIRAISDKADSHAETDYHAFEKFAIENSVRLVCGMIPEL